MRGLKLLELGVTLEALSPLLAIVEALTAVWSWSDIRKIDMIVRVDQTGRQDRVRAAKFARVIGTIAITPFANADNNTIGTYQHLTLLKWPASRQDGRVDQQL